MSTDYPAQILNHDGSEIELEGRVNFTDPANAPGGSQPIVSGAGSPVDSVTPTAGSPLYIDTTNGALYLATGATSADWIVLGSVPGNIGEASGVVVDNRTDDTYLLSGQRDDPDTGDITIGTAYDQWNGHSQGLFWVAGSGEANRALEVKTGATGQFNGKLQDADGNFRPGNTIDVSNIPTANPGPGLLWNDSGVLKIGT